MILEYIIEPLDDVLGTPYACGKISSLKMISCRYKSLRNGVR